MIRDLGKLLVLGAFVLTGMVAQADEVEAVHHQWSIESDEREWIIHHYSVGELGKLEIYLGDMLFQSILKNADGVYQIDELSKKILPVHANSGMREGPPKGEGMKARPRGPEKMLLPIEELHAPIGESVVEGEKTLSFSYEDDEAEIRMEIVENSVVLPRMLWKQFGSFQRVATSLTNILQNYHALPVEIEVKDSEHGFSKMSLQSKETLNMPSTFLNLPEGYFMQSRPMGGPGGGKGHGRKGSQGMGGMRSGSGMRG